MDSRDGRPLFRRFLRRGVEMPVDNRAPPGFWLSVAGLVLFALMAGVIFTAFFTPAMLADFAHILIRG